MEGDTPHWIDLINFDAGSDAQPWGYEENQGDLAAQGGYARYVRSAPLGFSFEPLSVDQTWPLSDPIDSSHPSKCFSPSVFSFQDLNSQQHVQQSSLSESAIYAEAVPQKYNNHDSWSDREVLEDVAGIEQPQVDSCLTPPESEYENRDQAYLNPKQKCSCMNCRFYGSGYTVKCKFPGCQEHFTDGHSYHAGSIHERTHFGKAGDYHCLKEGCKTTTKKWADLRRHCLNRHCTNATKFPCPYLGCKYGGDNGFTRKDKLKSHHRNVHQGKVVPGKASQLIKPKANGAMVIEGKPQAVQTIKPKPGDGA